MCKKKNMPEEKIQEQLNDIMEMVGGMAEYMTKNMVTKDEFYREINPLKQDVSGLKQDVSGLKQDVSVLKEDVSGLKQDVAVLKQDVSVLKNDVSVLKTDVAELKTDVSEIKDELVSVNGRLGMLDRDMKDVKHELRLIDRRTQEDVDMVVRDMVVLKQKAAL
jgi:chromosome segregation ATPase